MMPADAVYSNGDFRSLCQGFVCHSLSDTSVDSWGLVPGSHLLCNYIFLSTYLHSSTFTHAGRCAHARTKHLFHFTSAHRHMRFARTHAHSHSHTPSASVSLIKSSASQLCLCEGWRQRDRVKGGSAKQSEEHQRITTAAAPTAASQRSLSLPATARLC